MFSNGAIPFPNCLYIFLGNTNALPKTPLRNSSFYATLNDAKIPPKNNIFGFLRLSSPDFKTFSDQTSSQILRAGS